MRPATALIPLLALCGCASVPGLERAEPTIANGEAIARGVQLCKSSVAALETQLGRPSREGRLGRMRVVTWIVEWDPLVKYLGVMADDAGTVVDVYWNLPSEVTWSPTNRCK